MKRLSPGMPGGWYRPVRTLFGCLLLFSGSFAPGFARQSPRQSPIATPDPFGERIEVRAINVETVVTDRRGRRVSGLTAKDFELRIDGKPTPLEFFLEVKDSRAVAPAAAAEPTAPSLPPAAAPGDRVPQNYLVFIDELSSPIVQRKSALKKLAGELDRLGPDDRMAVVAAGHQELTVLSPWSRSKKELAATLEASWHRKGYISPFAPSSIELAEEGVGEAGDPRIGAQDGTLPTLELRHFLRTIRAATQALRAFADVPGRKVMLFISGNWIGCYESNDRRSGCDYVRPLTDTGNLLGYTIYPVRLDDPIDTLPGAERREKPRPGEAIRTAGLFPFMQNQIPMALTASETGGKLLSLSERFLTHAAEDVSSYYWLGFSADAPTDGRRRLIEVRVKGQDYQVRTRSSYLPISREAEESLRTESALIAGQPGPRARPLEIVRHPLEKAGRGATHLPLDLAIPVEELTLLPVGKDWIARLELHTLAIDRQGERSPMTTIPIELRFASQPKGAGKIVYSTTLAIRAVPQKIELQLTDSASGKVLSARLEVAAADLPAR
jgi:VWFA-related protein